MKPADSCARCKKPAGKDGLMPIRKEGDEFEFACAKCFFAHHKTVAENKGRRAEAR